MESAKNPADLLTKGVSRDTLERLRPVLLHEHEGAIVRDSSKGHKPPWEGESSLDPGGGGRSQHPSTTRGVGHPSTQIQAVPEKGHKYYGTMSCATVELALCIGIHRKTVESWGSMQRWPGNSWDWSN